MERKNPPLNIFTQMSETTQFEDYDQSEEENSESEGEELRGGAEEEEALSLSDLPLITSIHEDHHHHHQQKSQPIKTQEEKHEEGEEEEFDFGSLMGPIKAFDSEMCSADEVFFRGQILPFRHSVSCSDTGLRNHISKSLSRSESMDRGSASGLQSSSLTSSRSSSTKSHYSSSSSTSSSSSNNNSARKPKIQNHFHSYPSPKPQIRASGTRSGPNSAPSRKSTSSLWEFLRLGLVRAPEIELTDLKARTRRSSYTKSGPIISRSSSNSSNSGNLRAKCSADNLANSNYDHLDAKNGRRSIDRSHKLLRFYDKNGGIFNGCKCSVLAVEPIPATRVIVVNGGSEGAAINEDDRERREEKQQQQKQKQRQGGQPRKKAASRSRTFEWLKDISHTGVLNPVV